jgi:hypothetical protein
MMQGSKRQGTAPQTESYPYKFRCPHLHSLRWQRNGMSGICSSRIIMTHRYSRTSHLAEAGGKTRPRLALTYEQRSAVLCSLVTVLELSLQKCASSVSRNTVSALVQCLLDCLLPVTIAKICPVRVLERFALPHTLTINRFQLALAV